MEEKYNKLIESITIDNIEVSALECKKNKISENNSGELAISIQTEIIETRLEGIELQVDFKVKVFTFFDIEEEVKVEGVKEEEKLFTINSVLSLKYVLDFENIDDLLSEDIDSVIEIFVERNVKINAWPYVREIVSNMTTRMGFPQLIIPPYKKLTKF